MASSMERLNDALFAELGRLESIDASDKDALRDEIDRAKAVSGLASSITANHRLALEVARERASAKVCESIHVPAMLGEGE